MPEAEADIGLIGLAVMGQNLVLNMADNGFTVAVFNRTTSKVDDFTAGPAAGKSILGTHSLEAFCQSLKAPRRIMLMVKAGSAVDDFIELLKPYLDESDIIIDGGNSLYTDTQRRVDSLAKQGFRFLGVGVSGGEEGARFGPSLMPGGDPEAWPAVKDIFQAISAKVDGQACCEWMGEGGAGHYVKMVHNGIEYGDMQLICEAYQALREGLNIPFDDLQGIFEQWNGGVLDSYLIEITRDILGVRDTDNAPLVDKVLDTAGQKGTGKWTGINALESGIPLTLIGEAVFARFLSTLKEQRVQAAKQLRGPTPPPVESQDQALMINNIHDALYASKIISYAQGFMLMASTSDEKGWNLNYGNIALVWRGGCIIRSRFLNNIKEAFEKKTDLNNLLLDGFFRDAIHDSQTGWRSAIQFAVGGGIPTPAFSAALAFYDGYRSATLPANLLQAQRDYFGAHTYERIDKPRGEVFHSDWSGKS
ncbi:MAG: decarboxylating NADP(+)-dependent phosphogluconate dehydrogenase [Ectothiorhodospiraceae bacterium]|nr:decarboxylating NADP(+)-dependent phosphogluconate dehydrogenase [Ectothiorhodospiraceae bacterium]